jgi:UDP-N-acetylmuramate: L-alanyl-gamma-D-glutamyl-meso-diaminopimelate ligase
MHIHILGICGTFMGSLALIAKQQGHRISGCDANVYPPMSTQLERNGVTLVEGFNIKQLDPSPDLVIIGNAMTRGNPCVEYVLNSKIPYVSGPEWLGENILRRKYVLSVSGTHGKTTTSSMLTKILDDAGLNPGFLIGGIAQDFDTSARLSDGDYFVIEADEYDSAFFDKRSKFIHYFSDTLIINNLEFDHADIFDDISAIQKQFHHLVRTIPSDGNIILPKGCEAIDAFMDLGCWSKTHMFGPELDNLWCYQLLESDGSKFKIRYSGSKRAEEDIVDWAHSGLHNVNNAVSATVAAHLVGVSLHQACAALSTFKGVKRRMEVIYSDTDIVIYDDFAHHPTAIKTTLDGLRAKVGGEFIIAIIEPRSATMKMGIHGQDLATSVASADEVIWYQSSSINWDMTALTENVSLSSRVIKNLEELIEATRSLVRAKTHVVIMSNGGFEGFHLKLVQSFQGN